MEQWEISYHHKVTVCVNRMLKCFCKYDPCGAADEPRVGRNSGTEMCDILYKDHNTSKCV